MKEALDGRFSEFFDSYIRRVFSFFLYRVDDALVAEDLTSHTFLKAYGGYARFTEKSQAQTTGWIFQIAANTLKNWYRYQANNATYSLDTLPQIVVEKHLLTVDRPLMPEELTLQKEQQKVLYHALKKLPDDYQNVLILRYTCDLSSAEVATALSRTESAVKSIQHRALEKLRNTLTAGVHFME